nr:immunoglobulin light chain junction region [Macaca mulatta]MOV94573.1 immunoglobulin light chain junction region [Macaca mulatta]MOV95353.1 immunoglobulin light chain junction region [Macaca mulatta]MOV96112.1 immunoglobulin light chain junction region [Macaca mulatta]MOV97011.1 immunoglobulin light chain junction region [Macaca mulatta]
DYYCAVGHSSGYIF